MGSLEKGSEFLVYFIPKPLQTVAKPFPNRLSLRGRLSLEHTHALLPSQVCTFTLLSWMLRVPMRLATKGAVGSSSQTNRLNLSPKPLFSNFSVSWQQPPAPTLAHFFATFLGSQSRAPPPVASSTLSSSFVSLSAALINVLAKLKKKFYLLCPQDTLYYPKQKSHFPYSICQIMILKPLHHWLLGSRYVLSEH